jgi:hypothetical protein
MSAALHFVIPPAPPAPARRGVWRGSEAEGTRSSTLGWNNTGFVCQGTGFATVPHCAKTGEGLKCPRENLSTQNSVPQGRLRVAQDDPDFL